jgi:hypothetical protein
MIHHDCHVSHVGIFVVAKYEHVMHNHHHPGVDVGVFVVTKYEHVMHNHHHPGVDVGVFVIDLNNIKFYTSIYNNMPKILVAIQVARKMIPNLIHSHKHKYTLI